jgi:uncharacterized protein YceK
MEVSVFKLIVITILLSGCVSIKHEHNQKPKLEIDSPYADETYLKLRRKSIEIELEWKL